jgi:hypothetical protein
LRFWLVASIDREHIDAQPDRVIRISEIRLLLALDVKMLAT